MSKQTKRPAKAGKHITQAQAGDIKRQANDSLKAKIERAKEAATEGARFLNTLGRTLSKVNTEFLSQGTAPYGKDFHAILVEPTTKKRWAKGSRFKRRECEWLFVTPSGKRWEATGVYKAMETESGDFKAILDPAASSLKEEDWLFVSGKPKTQLLPHLWTQCKRANPKGLPYIAPEQPKTFKVVEREKVDPKVTAKPNGIKVYSYGSPDITFGDYLTVVLNG